MSFANLSIRERWMLIIGAALLVTLLVWRFGWQPIQTERAALREDITRYLTLISVAERADTITAAPVLAPTDSRPVPVRITQSAEEAGVSLTRLEPEGDGMRVAIEEVAFENLIDWISGMEARNGLRAASVEIDRRPGPGQVSARVTLEPAT